MSKWAIQSGKGKSSYVTRQTHESESVARRWYAMLNTHSGCKKRLVSPDGIVVSRYISY